MIQSPLDGPSAHRCQPDHDARSLSRGGKHSLTSAWLCLATERIIQNFDCTVQLQLIITPVDTSTADGTVRTFLSPTHRDTTGTRVEEFFVV